MVFISFRMNEWFINDIWVFDIYKIWFYFIKYFNGIIVFMINKLDDWNGRNNYNGYCNYCWNYIF